MNLIWCVLFSLYIHRATTLSVNVSHFIDKHGVFPDKFYWNLNDRGKDFFHELLPREVLLKGHLNLTSRFVPKCEINECLQNLAFILSNLSEPNEWSSKLLDSYGKLESGLLLTHNFFAGEFQLCQSIRVKLDNESSFGGKYCKAKWTFPVNSQDNLELYSGICIPDSCSEKDFAEIRQFLQNFPFPDFKRITNLTELSCHEPRRITFDSIIFLVLMIICLVPIVLAAIVDSFEDENLDLDETFEKMVMQTKSRPEQTNLIRSQGFRKVLSCFSLSRNVGLITNLDHRENDVKVIHTLRAISIFAVFVNHLNYFGLPYSRNSIVSMKAFAIIFNWIFSGGECVDTFFTISGFLSSFRFFSRSRKENIICRVVFRYLALLPLIIICLLFSISAVHHLASGPFSNHITTNEDLRDVCIDTGWLSLFFIYNPCMPQIWYLSCDILYFTASPLFLNILKRNQKYGTALCVLIIACISVVNFLIVLLGDFSNGIGLRVDFDRIQDLRKVNRDFLFSGGFLYVNPLARLPPYLIGIIFGQILASQKKTNPRTSLSNKIAIKSVILFSILVLYLPLICHIGRLGRFIYLSTFRLAWSIGVVFVIFHCEFSRRGPIKSFLESKLFLPLSRLSFPIFVFHFATLAFTSFSLQHVPDYTGIMAYYILFGSFSLTVLVSMFFTLVIGLPLFNLISLVRGTSTNR